MSQPARNGVPGMDLPDLAELDLPGRVSLFPQTLAWKLLLLGLLLALLVVLLLRYRRHLRQCWRRQAAALARAAQASASSGAWFELIKRVCLVHMPREQLAALSDAAILERLPQLDAATRQALLESHRRRHERLADDSNTALARAFADWLRELPDAR